MRLPTIIELIDMSETTHQKTSKVDIDEAIFQPFPSEIIFQNFKPFETYQVICLVNLNRHQFKDLDLELLQKLDFRFPSNCVITTMSPVLSKLAQIPPHTFQ